jgi:hypothetical protein
MTPFATSKRSRTHRMLCARPQVNILHRSNQSSRRGSHTQPRPGTSLLPTDLFELGCGLGYAVALAAPAKGSVIPKP